MTGEYTAPRRTPVEHESLRAAIARAWEALRHEAPASEGVSMLLAQSGFETGQWSKCWNWNLGGIKSSGRGLHTFVATTEVFAREEGLAEVAKTTTDAPCELAEDLGGETVTVRYLPNHPYCRFRAFRTIDEAAEGFVRLHLQEHEAASVCAEAGDVVGFVRALKEGGYFTGPQAVYARGVARFYDGYRTPCLATTWEVVQAFSRLKLWPADDYRNVVLRFQAEHGCAIDGVVGPETRRAIRAELAALNVLHSDTSAEGTS